MSRQRLIAFLAAVAAVVGLVILVPMSSPASAATCASAWNSSSVYTGGMTASYNSHNWSAKWWTQGETPGAADVWADQGTCTGGSGGTGGTTGGSGGCSYPAWVAGRAYVTGDIVQYTNGLDYIATHDNPGYDPTISTWYWSPYTCSGTGGTTGGSTQPPTGGFVVSEAQFNQMFPSRNSFYTYSGLTAALSAYPGFANTGSDTVKKQEAAAFLANVSHETGGLVYIVEQNTANYSHYCDTSQSYGCPAGQSAYYGRGPIQLSWNFNYKAAKRLVGHRPAGQPQPRADRLGHRLEDRPVVLEHPVGTRHDDPAQRHGQRRRFRRDHPQHQRQHRVQRRQPRPGAVPRQRLHELHVHPGRADRRQPLLLTARRLDGLTARRLEGSTA